MEPSEERHDQPERCCFDDWVDSWDRKTQRRDTVNAVTASLLKTITELGVSGRTVLDVGCGIGDLAIGIVAAGATSATGYDLSPKAIDRARALAQRRGVGDRTTFEVGDGSKFELPKADIVTINRVVCCYHDADGILERTLAAAGSVYAISAPISSGATGIYNRTQNAFWNVVYRLRDEHYGGLRTFIHDIERIDGRINATGFRRVHHERRRVVWDLAVYAR
ncbi:MAG TPA: class I SAM-dependent methyltransferase [Actinomycetota bacterium]|nr:class I SAM-dependent methyltransferase [Actinomycetota bacterium]